MNAAVNMRFGSEVHDGAGLMLGKQAVDQGASTDIALHETLPGIALQAGEVLKIARAGQLVQIDDELVTLFEPVQNKVTANEAGSAGNQNTHLDM